ncbi:MAG: filamentous hemagglutinin N-terminal domain-containing protein [Planctomycetota bacterium]
MSSSRTSLRSYAHPRSVQNPERPVAPHRTRILALSLPLLLALTMLASGQDVVVSDVPSGAASVDVDGHHTTITASDGAIIEYHQFGVGAGNVVQFVQPDSMSRVLNRVVGSDPSLILGRLEANGNVYLVNPAGVIFGPHALVDVSGLVAAAAQMDNLDFTNGVDRFTGTQGHVANSGRISAASFAHFVGRTVANDGVILAPNGVVTLTSGATVYLKELGSELLVEVDGGAVPISASSPVVTTEGVSQRGWIEANDVAFSSGDVYSFAIQHSGVTRAAGGRVVASGAGRAELSGTVDVSASDAAGGTIRWVGRDVHLRGAEVRADGTTGGLIEVGGARRGDPVPTGAGPGVADRVAVDADSVLSVDALGGEDGGDGGGGEVTVWSERVTAFAGAATARGAGSGSGGFVEVSSRGRLGFVGTVDTTSPWGTDGVLLLDPDTIEVITGGGVAASDVDAFLDVGSDPGVSRIDPATLDAVGGSVVLEARTAIIVTSPIALSTNGAGITARAGGTITLDASITTRGGDVILTANDPTSGAATGTGSIVLSAAIHTDAGGQSGGDVTLTTMGGTGTVDVGAAIVSSGNVTLAGPVNLTGGAVGSPRTIDAAGAVTFSSTVDGNRTLFVRAPSGVTTFLGEVGGTTPLTGLSTDLGGGTVLAADVTAGSGGIEWRDAVTIAADVVTTTLGGGDVRFGSTVDSDGIPRNLTVLVLDAAGTTVSPTGIIELGDDVGGSSPLTSLALNVAAGINARASVPTSATIVGESDLSITATGSVTIGASEKLTVLGALDIDAGGTVTLGDVSTLGDLSVDAPVIVITLRPASFVRDPADRLFLDAGVDLVSGGVFRFTTAPTTVGVGPALRFATGNGQGDALGTLGGFGFSSVGQLSFARFVGNRGSVAGRTLDLGVFAVAPEAGLASVVRRGTLEDFGRGVPNDERQHDPTLPETEAPKPRIRRHEYSSWLGIDAIP